MFEGHVVFFFQAEDGIRDLTVTGVQTCALPILLRNDLSRVCRVGSVGVPELFALEHYQTVHHLVSTVVGELAPEHDALDLVRAAFPGGADPRPPQGRAGPRLPPPAATPPAPEPRCPR